MSGADWVVTFDLDLIPAQIEAAAPIALARGAEHVRGVAVLRTGKQSGHLAGSAGVRVYGAGLAAVAEVEYPGPYAAYQNRGMRADGSHVIRNRPAGGQTGFLTQTMDDQADAARDIIGDTIWQLIG